MIGSRICSRIVIRNFSSHYDLFNRPVPSSTYMKRICTLWSQASFQRRNASKESFSDEQQNEERGKQRENKVRRYKKIFSTFLFASTLAGILFARRRKKSQLAENFEGCSGVRPDEYFRGGRTEFFHYRKDPSSPGCVLPAQIIKDGTLKAIKSFKVYPDDVFVAGFPRTGITWVQEIVYLIKNNMNFEKASENVLETRFPYLEYQYPGLSTLVKQPSPRLIKTHLPLDLLPDDVLTSKVIYVTRNPKDVAVSYFHFARGLTFSTYDGPFSDFLSKFQSDKLPYCPFFENMDSYIKHEDNPNLLVVTYEDLSNDPAEVIKKIAHFLDNPLTDSDVNLLVNHTEFKSMVKNPATNYKHWDDIGIRNKNEAHFMRNGKVGDWRNYFNEEEINQDFDKWLQEKNKAKFKFQYEI